MFYLSGFQIEYIKLVGGSDYNTAIKLTFKSIMHRSVLKQLSWTGTRTTRPSLQTRYKCILDGIHVAMKESFKDYTIALGEATMKSLV